MLSIDGNRATCTSPFSLAPLLLPRGFRHNQRKNFLARENSVEKDRQFIREVARKSRMCKGDLSPEHPRMS
jgi:hypothetical protein